MSNSAPTVAQVAGWLERLAPPRLAEEWDNVGLLVGDSRAAAARIMTCLTITPDSAEEAADSRVDLVVAHHPLPFRPLKRITTESSTGRLLLRLIGAGVAVYSAHTAFDSAAAGINSQWGGLLGLGSLQPLSPRVGDPDGLGAGRWGRFATPRPLSAVAADLKRQLRVDHVMQVGEDERPVTKVAVACGSGGSFVAAASRLGCDLLLTGEATFHTCLEAEAADLALLLPGHFASERFGVESLASSMAEAFPAATIWASRRERDPLRRV